MPGELYVGASSPVSTILDVYSTGAPFDLATATAGRMVVKFDNGSSATWACSIVPVPPDVALQSTRIRLVRLHAPSDLPPGSEGTLRIRADVDIPAAATPLRTRWAAVQVLRDGA